MLLEEQCENPGHEEDEGQDFPEEHGVALGEWWVGHGYLRGIGLSEKVDELGHRIVAGIGEDRERFSQGGIHP